MTNEEWLKSLDIEELAKLLGSWFTVCADEVLNKPCRELDCNVCAKYWLKQEHKK